MKKIIAILLVISALLLSCLPVLAGDVPEALSYEDEAKVFIGTLVEVTDEKPYQVTVLPILKIKGEVKTGVEETYSSCYFPKATPKQGAEYFFGCFDDDEVYAYEVKNRTEDQITLYITDEFSERIQNYLDEGLYERAEIDRVNVGRQLSLTEYMGTDGSYVEKVTFSLNGVNYDINAEKFFEVSDKIFITDVKDRILQRMGADDWDDDILYIQLTLKDGRNGGGFASVTRFCEVDRCHPMMSRIPSCDFTMSWEDLAKLYEFLPDDVQRELYAKNGAESNSSVSPVVTGAVIGAVAGAGIGCVVGMILHKKKKNKE